MKACGKVGTQTRRDVHRAGRASKLRHEVDNVQLFPLNGRLRRPLAQLCGWPELSRSAATAMAFWASVSAAALWGVRGARGRRLRLECGLPVCGHGIRANTFQSRYRPGVR